MADIATLGIEVRSESLLRAAQNLDRFAGVTQRVEQRVQGFSTGMTNMQGSIDRLSNSVTNAGRVMSGFNSALQVLGIGVAANEMKNYADSWTRMGNKIAAASQSSGVQARSLIELRQGADNARSSLDEYVDLYARIMRNSKGVAKSEQEVADATNIVSKAFAVGGAAASEQAAGVLQLGQALGSGFLQGDELRSIRENAPVLAQAIADEFGTTIAGLKDLGAEGKLTSDRILKAILNARQQIDAQFNKTSLTIEQSLTLVKNGATQFIGAMDGITGSSRTITTSLKGIADNFEYVGNGILLAGGIAATKIFAPLIAQLGASTLQQIKLTSTVLEGNAVMLNSRTAALLKANASKQAALADQQAAKAALDLARAEAVKTKATLEAATAQKGTIFASTSMGKASSQQATSKHALAISDLTAKEKAYAAATIIAANKTDIADKALKRASGTAKILGGAMSIASKAMNFVGGPIGATILAVGTAMYYSAQKAEEAHEKSQKLQKVWDEMGYSAPLTAKNIDKISEAIVRFNQGDQFRHIQDSNKELDRLLQKKSDRKASEDLPVIGTALQGDELITKINQAKKVTAVTAEDKNALKILREQAELVQKFPSLAGEAKQVLEGLLKTNVNSNVADVLRETISSLDTIQTGLNGLNFNGFNRGLEQADHEFEFTMKSWGKLLGEDKVNELNALEEQMKTTGMSAEEFSKKARNIIPQQGYSYLLQSIDLIGKAFANARKQAEETEKVINRIDQRRIEVSVNLTGIGYINDIMKTAKNEEPLREANYEQLLADAKKTKKQKDIDAIKAQLNNGTTVKYDSAKLTKEAEEIYNTRQEAKNAEKVAEQAEHAAQREANAYRDLIKSGQDRVGQLELEAQVAGKAGIAADTLRMKLELEQKATDKGRSITAKKREEIDKLVNSYQKAAEATAKAQLNADLSYRWRQMGRSDIDQSVADTLKQYGLEENLNSVDAANIRLLETTNRNRQAWQRFGDTAEDALYRIIAGTDDWRSSLASLLPTLKDLVLQLAGLSDNKNSLGGLLGSYFTGGGGGFFASGGDKIFQAGVAQGFKSNSLANALASGANGLFAQGGVFSPTARLFAKGGAFFTNSIVDRPTPFRFADGDGFGNGLMGEAGPEAVMPLKRDARGSLGVAVNGWGRGAPAQQQEQKTVVVHVEPSDYFDIRVKEIAEQVSQNNIRQFQENMPNIIGQTINEARMKNRM